MALFYRLTPYKTLAFRGARYTDSKSSRESIAVLLCMNLTGPSKLFPLITEKYRSPQCVKNVHYLPGKCGHSVEAWMLGKWLQVVNFVTGMLNTGRGIENSASDRKLLSA